MPIWIGVDVGVKHDATAIVAATWCNETKRVKLVWTATFHPSEDSPLDINSLIPYQIVKLRSRFQIRQVLFDPHQMIAIAQRLSSQGVPMVELPQTSQNLTEATTTLYSLIKHKLLVVRPDPAMRHAVTHASVAEVGRGWKLTKNSQGDKIDLVVALSMACLGAVSQGETIDQNSVGWAFASPIITTLHKNTGLVATLGAPRPDGGPPEHYLARGQSPRPWASYVDGGGIRSDRF